MHRNLPHSRHLAAVAAAALLLGACADAGDDDPAAAPAEATSADEGSGTDADGGGADTDGGTDDAATLDDDGTTAAAGDGGGEQDDAPGDGGTAADPLLAIAATAPDGSTFTIGDAAGRPVLVETFATWCSNCRRQLADTQAAAEQAGDDVVVLALSVETSLDPAALDAYAADNGFEDIRFGVLDEQGLVTLEDRFGGSVLNPPATPKFRVDPDGTVSGLTTGFESTEEILASLGA